MTKIFSTLICLAMLFWLASCAHVETQPPPGEDAGIQPASEADPPPALDEGKPSPAVDAQGEGADEEPIEEEFGEEEFLEEEYVEGIADPIEPWNRAMFHFNDKLYFWVLKPAARGYRAVVPQWGRQRVSSFFDHISMPISFANSLLQLKIKAALTDLSRFILNTTIGVGGLFDMAANIDLEKSDEDLGQTLGRYGLGHGIYIVWPFLGPSSVRDTVGGFGDGFLYPVNYLEGTEVVLGVHAYDRVNETSLTIGDYEDVKDSAIDPYVAFRDAYFQYREDKLKK